jgi:hypothetical protein
LKSFLKFDFGRVGLIAVVLGMKASSNPGAVIGATPDRQAWLNNSNQTHETDDPQLTQGGASGGL